MEVPEPSQSIEKPGSSPSVSWLKHPWLVLICGSALLLALWVGLRVRIEYQRNAALEELRNRDDVRLRENGTRVPEWLPGWLRDLLPENLESEWSQLTQVNLHDCQDDRVLLLLSRIGEAYNLALHGDCKFSDDALLQLFESHRFHDIIFWSQSFKLTAQHLAVLRQQGNISQLWGLGGPFNEQQLRELAGMSSLESLHLDGPLDTTAKVPVIHWPRLTEFRWHESQLTDAQFEKLVAASPVTNLQLDETRLTSQSWPLLERMPLELVRIARQHIDDTLLTSLARIPSLEIIYLPDATITDSGVQELAALPRLESFEIPASGLTIAGARHLRECKSLRSLRLNGGSNVTDEWIAEMVQDRLKHLDIPDSAITDAGVATLQKTCRLEYLDLSGSRVTDGCLQSLSLMTDLGDLDLSDTAITDEGLKHAQLMRGSVGAFFPPHLTLDGTRVTPEGVKEFLRQNRNPNVRVSVGPSPAFELRLR